jgi:predicted DNA-binding transcriptional regulator AlpA
MITNDYIPQKTSIPPLLKVRDVAKLLSLSRVTVHALIESGDLQASSLHPTRPKTKAKRLHVRITRASLIRFYQKRFGHPLNLALQNPFPS